MTDTSCKVCGATEERESFAQLLLVEDHTISFCSSACVLAFLESDGIAGIARKPFVEAAQHCFGDAGCCECSKNGDLQWYDQDEDARRLKRESEELFARSRDLGEPDGDEFKRLRGEADGLYAKARVLLQEKYPAYREPFIIMNGWYPAPTDRGVIFCSVACVKAYFGDERNRSWDAKLNGSYP